MGVENSRNFLLCQHYVRVSPPSFKNSIDVSNYIILILSISLLNILCWMLVLFTKVTY